MSIEPKEWAALRARGELAARMAGRLKPDAMVRQGRPVLDVAVAYGSGHLVIRVIDGTEDDLQPTVLALNPYSAWRLIRSVGKAAEDLGWIERDGLMSGAADKPGTNATKR